MAMYFPIVDDFVAAINNSNCVSDDPRIEELVDKAARGICEQGETLEAETEITFATDLLLHIADGVTDNGRVRTCQLLLSGMIAGRIALLKKHQKVG